jgi:hypothetical protein
MEILGPSNNRPLDISDENVPLSTLFKRSATLVLVPIQSITSAAYAGAGAAAATTHGILSQAYSLISGALNTVWSWGSFAPRAEEPPPPPPPSRRTRGEGRRVGTSSTTAGVRTLRDQQQQDESGEKKYYNGNQVCFLLTRGDVDINGFSIVEL